MEVAPGIYSLGDGQGGRVRAHLLDDGQGITVVDSLMAADGHLMLNELLPLIDNADATASQSPL